MEKKQRRALDLEAAIYRKLDELGPHLVINPNARQWLPNVWGGFPYDQELPRIEIRPNTTCKLPAGFWEDLDPSQGSLLANLKDMLLEIHDDASCAPVIAEYPNHDPVAVIEGIKHYCITITSIASQLWSEMRQAEVDGDRRNEAKSPQEGPGRPKNEAKFKKITKALEQGKQWRWIASKFGYKDARTAEKSYCDWCRRNGVAPPE